MSALRAGKSEQQWEWHEAHRDMAKNMYRTSYSDMVHGRETYVKSDFPAGYGGHIQSMRFDILHRNTQFDRTASLKRTDPSRDAFPAFSSNIDGIPGTTAHPQGSKSAPTKGVVPHDGTTTQPKPPWGRLNNPKLQLLSQRFLPPEGSPMMRRTSSLPSIRQAAPYAQNAGSLQPTPNGMQLKMSVDQANHDAQRLQMPLESDILMGEQTQY